MPPSLNFDQMSGLPRTPAGLSEGRSTSSAEAATPAPRMPATPPPRMQWQKPQPIACGLSNLGNSCYLNSTIQCLAALPPLGNHCLRSKHHLACTLPRSHCSACLLESRIQRCLSGREDKVQEPREVFDNLRLFSPTFTKYAQEDAHEFLRYVLDAWERDESKGQGKLVEPGKTVKDPNTYVNELFSGWLQSSVTCSRCHHESSTYDPFMDISLEITADDCRSVQDALRKYTEVEHLNGDNKWRCPCCNQLVDATKQLAVFDEPNVLAIQLKRFSFWNDGRKIQKRILFSDVLSLEPYCARGMTEQGTTQLKMGWRESRVGGTEAGVSGVNGWRANGDTLRGGCGRLTSEHGIGKEGGAAGFLGEANDGPPCLGNGPPANNNHSNGNGVGIGWHTSSWGHGSQNGGGTSNGHGSRSSSSTKLANGVANGVNRDRVTHVQGVNSDIGGSNCNGGPAAQVPTGRAVYSLRAVLVHQGYTTKSGHYYAYVRDGQSKQGKWHQMNDAQVTPVDFSSVQNDEHGAYILFYTRTIGKSRRTPPRQEPAHVHMSGGVRYVQTSTGLNATNGLGSNDLGSNGPCSNPLGSNGLSLNGMHSPAELRASPSRHQSPAGAKSSRTLIGPQLPPEWGQRKRLLSDSAPGSESAPSGSKQSRPLQGGLRSARSRGHVPEVASDAEAVEMLHHADSKPLAQLARRGDKSKSELRSMRHSEGSGSGLSGTTITRVSCSSATPCVAPSPRAAPGAAPCHASVSEGPSNVPVSAAPLYAPNSAADSNATPTAAPFNTMQCAAHPNTPLAAALSHGPAAAPITIGQSFGHHSRCIPSHLSHAGNTQLASSTCTPCPKSTLTHIGGKTTRVVPRAVRLRAEAAVPFEQPHGSKGVLSAQPTVAAENGSSVQGDILNSVGCTGFQGLQRRCHSGDDSMHSTQYAASPSGLCCKVDNHAVEHGGGTLPKGRGGVNVSPGVTPQGHSARDAPYNTSPSGTLHNHLPRGAPHHASLGATSREITASSSKAPVHALDHAIHRPHHDTLYGHNQPATSAMPTGTPAPADPKEQLHAMLQQLSGQQAAQTAQTPSHLHPCQTGHQQQDLAGLQQSPKCHKQQHAVPQSTAQHSASQDSVPQPSILDASQRANQQKSHDNTSGSRLPGSPLRKRKRDESRDEYMQYGRSWLKRRLEKRLRTDAWASGVRGMVSSHKQQGVALLHLLSQSNPQAREQARLMVTPEIKQELCRSMQQICLEADRLE